jgi:transposase
VGDARATAFEDNAFDIVFSNSVIEHLGDSDSQAQFAREVRRLAPNYFVQTPDKRFPVEPHFLAPFVHWLPPRIRRRVVRNFSVWGLVTRPSFERCCELVREIRLLSKREMRNYFPDAELITEHFLGMPKSLISVRVCTQQRRIVPTCNEFEAVLH